MTQTSSSLAPNASFQADDSLISICPKGEATKRMMHFYNTPLSLDECASIDSLRTSLFEIIGERDGTTTTSEPFKASDYWAFFSDVCEYVRAMPAAQFKSLRLHTYHLDGATYQNTFFSRGEDWADTYRTLVRDLPERYWLSAPRCAGEFGFDVDGRLVNEHVIMWQEVVVALWRKQIIQKLEQTDHPVLVEIGTGYGSFAYHMLSILPHATYVAIDLPETLLFSTSYMTLTRGASRMQLAGAKSLLQETIAPGTFVAVPNTKLSLLSDWKFDFASNFYSFQEMHQKQVEQYVSFLAPRTRQMLSCNHERQKFNRQEVSVSSVLNAYFELADLPSEHAPRSTWTLLSAAASNFVRAAIPPTSKNRMRLRPLIKLAAKVGVINGTSEPLQRLIGSPKKSG